MYKRQLQVFDIPFVMTSGGPGYASSTFTLYTINTAFTYSNFGLASTCLLYTSTIVDADLILVMENGNIIEQGRHRELVKADGPYAQLYYSQFA